MGTTLICPTCQREGDCGLKERSGDFSIYQCPDCGHQFAQPLTYSESYYDGAHSEDLSRIRLTRVTRRHMWRKAPVICGAHQLEALKWLKGHLPAGAPVLDIGCGSGWFLALLEREGFAAAGTEVAKETVEILRAKGFRVHCGPISGCPREWPRPQSVTLFEVIEHVPSPVEFLKEIREAFPTACLLLSTPCPSRWTLKLGWREKVDYPPNHLHRWSLESLRTALLRAGYESVEFAFPKVRAQEVYGETLHALFFLSGLKGLRAQAPSPAQPNSRGHLVATLTKLGGPITWCYDRSFDASRALFSPAAWYFNVRGWASQSMLAMALPVGHSPPSPSGA